MTFSLALDLQSVTVESLWKDSDAVIIFMRRFG